LIEAYFPHLAPNKLAHYALQFPEGLKRDASALLNDLFAAAVDTVLDPGCPLSSLSALDTNSQKPLIINCNQAEGDYLEN
jgi:hypothetical protein